MSSFRNLLSSLRLREAPASTPEERKALVVKFEALLDKYENLPDINEDYRKDIQMAMVAVCDLAETLSAKLYNIDEVLHATIIVQACLNRVLDYSRTARPRVRGYAILNDASGKILPNFFCSSELEAKTIIENLLASTSGASYSVVQGDLTSSFAVAPSAPVLIRPPQPPVLPPIVPVETPKENNTNPIPPLPPPFSPTKEK